MSAEKKLRLDNGGAEVTQCGLIKEVDEDTVPKEEDSAPEEEDTVPEEEDTAPEEETTAPREDPEDDSEPEKEADEFLRRVTTLLPGSAHYSSSVPFTKDVSLIPFSYGRGKVRRHLLPPFAPPQLSSPIEKYGEDTTFITHTKGGLAFGVFDGHGQQGSIASSTMARVAMTKMTETMDQVVKALEDRASHDVERVDEEVYEAMETEAVNKRLIGGTTASTVRVVRTPSGRYYLVVSHVGDSPVIFCSSSKVLVLGGKHGCDEPDAYGKYLERCRSQRLEPLPVYYGRLNLAGGQSRVGPDGLYRPMPVYVNGTNTIDERMAKHVASTLQPVGGSQSLCKMVNKKGDKVLKGYEHTNWGSTINGTLQMLRSLGDLEVKESCHLSHLPDTIVMEWNPVSDPEACVIAISDGVGDCMFPHQIADVALSNLDNPAKAVYDAAVERAIHVGGQIGYKTSSDGRPYWDDMSVVCVVLSAEAPY